VIRDFQEAGEHIGKMPRKISETSRLRRKLIELERHLERQIAEEEYESATAVRDEIREIETMIDTEGKKREH